MTDSIAQNIANSVLSRVQHADSVVVFLGAGGSLAAGIPSWTDLVDQVMHEVHVTRARDRDQPEQAARSAALKLVKALGGGAQVPPSSLHYAIARLRPQAVVTTNYDDLLERAFVESGVAPTVLTGSDLAAAAATASPTIFKLHGSWDKPESLALTPGAALASRESVAADWRLRAMLNTSLVLLVGYSHDSGELEALYEDFGSATVRQPWFLLTNAVDPIAEELWFRRGVETVHVGQSDVAEVLAELGATRSPHDRPAQSRHGTRVFVSSSPRNADRRRQLVSLLMKLGLETVELSAFGASGRTVFEKLEQAVEESAAAIVVLDEGVAAVESSGGRQNLVFQLGYLTGRLGTSRVLVLVPPNADVPSDVAGLHYVLLEGPFESAVLQWARGVGLTPPVS